MKCSADDLADASEKYPVCHFCQSPPASQGRQRRQKIRGDRQRHHQRQGPRIAALRVLDFFGDGGELFVSGIEPQAQSQSDAEDFEGG
jgi:hypothetical protein